MVLYVMGLFAAALSTLAAMVFIMSANGDERRHQVVVAEDL